MVQNAIPLPKQVDQLMTRQEEQGQTAVLVAVGGIFMFLSLTFYFIEFFLLNIISSCGYI